VGSQYLSLYNGCGGRDNKDEDDVVAGSGWANRYDSISVRNCCNSPFTVATISTMADLLERSNTNSERQPGQAQPIAAISVCNLFAKEFESFTHTGWKYPAHTSQTGQEVVTTSQQAAHHKLLLSLFWKLCVILPLDFGAICTTSQTTSRTLETIMDALTDWWATDVTSFQCRLIFVTAHLAQPIVNRL